jgi:hypothetical protein
MTVGVLTMSVGCLGHLAIMPRWEVLLRANSAIADARGWLQAHEEDPTLLPPTYDSGDGPSPRRWPACSATARCTRGWWPWATRASPNASARRRGAARRSTPTTAHANARVCRAGVNRPCG